MLRKICEDCSDSAACNKKRRCIAKERQIERQMMPGLFHWLGRDAEIA